MLTNLKRNLGLLLAVATLSAVTALVPNTAGAAPSVVPNAGTLADPQTAGSAYETYVACPASSAAAAGFTDTTSTDVDCIKMFGITTGATATTYDPSGTIPRWAMALFIHRMFVPTGIAAAGVTAVPAFTDTSGLSADILAAISALASHGITVGTTATTYSPDDNVTREQMAIFLNRFATLAKDHAGAAITAVAAATGNYNYSDISGASWEGMESIVRLFNLGVTEGNCLAAACASTYRPTASITRAEMASMLTNLLNHTNARPAGVTIQAVAGFAAAGSKATLISARNADFSAQLNVPIDHFYDPTQLTTAHALASNAAFTAILGTVSGSVTSAQGTAGTIDSLDLMTNALGNVAGTTLTTAINSTTTWWAWTAAAGSIHVDGTTAGVAKLEAVMGAASTTVYADTTTVSISGANTLGEAEIEDYSGLNAAVIADDGIKTMAGASRTITATMTLASLTAAGTAHTVVDGYTFKFSDLKVDMLGNVSITNTYVASVNGAASYTVVCGADNSATVNGDAAASSSYWESHEVTITEATALGTGVGVSRPAAAATASTATYTLPTDGGDSASANISCDDEVRAYTAGTTGNTLQIGANTIVSSTAGTLVAVSATAYDQYGDGIAGVTTRVMKAQKATTGAEASAAQQAILTTGANGIATLNAVLCSSSFNGHEAFSISTTGATMSNIAVTEAKTPTTLATGLGGEGTTVYCAKAGTDQAIGAVAAARGTWTWTATAGGGIETQDSGALAVTVGSLGSFTITSSGAGDVTPTLVAAGFNGITGVTGVACVASGTANIITTCTFAIGTGVIGDGTAVSAVSTLVDSGVGDASDDAVEVTDVWAAGVDGVANLFVDDDPAANTLLTAVTITGDQGTDGASVATTTYWNWTYDGTDAFTLNATDAEVALAVTGASEAQFEAEAASLTGLAGATPVTLSYRIGALTTGISVFQLGA